MLCRVIQEQLGSQEHQASQEKEEREETEVTQEMTASLEPLYVAENHNSTAQFKVAMIILLPVQGPVGSQGTPGEQGPEGPKVRT